MNGVRSESLSDVRAVECRQRGTSASPPRWRSSARRRGGPVVRPTFRSPADGSWLGDQLTLHTHMAGFGPLKPRPCIRRNPGPRVTRVRSGALARVGGFRIAP
jgi:hypothetical protein